MTCPVTAISNGRPRTCDLTAQHAGKHRDVSGFWALGESVREGGAVPTENPSTDISWEDFMRPPPKPATPVARQYDCEGQRRAYEGPKRRI